MRIRSALIGWVLSIAAVGCSKSEPPPVQGTAVTSSPCGHAACSDHFFVDAVSGDCAAGAACDLKLQVVATGDYHINDDYPYRFKADPSPGVAFLGSDPAGKEVFSKPAGDWQKAQAKAGTMTVKFTPASSGPSTIAGLLKVSVCSAESCLLEQPRVSTVVAAK